jgi:hypothetical protein
MIHIATVHWFSDVWIDLQLRYLEQNVCEPYRVWACLEGVDERFAARFDEVVPAAGPHAGKLNLLAYHIGDVADSDDLIMFLDGDAFPIGDVVGVARAALRESDLLAIRRDENVGDRQPHPSFCMTSVETWHAIRGDWLSGYAWTAPDGSLVTDVGGNLLYLLERSGRSWTPLLRSHQFGDHPIWFGVYGSVVYHHGAGFRPAISRFDERDRPKNRIEFGSRIPLVGRASARYNRERQERWERERSAQMVAESEEVRRRLEDPSEFERLLHGGGDSSSAPIPDTDGPAEPTDA